MIEGIFVSLSYKKYVFFPSVTVIYNNYYKVAFMYISFQFNSTYTLEQALTSCVIFQACQIKQYAGLVTSSLLQLCSN